MSMSGIIPPPFPFVEAWPRVFAGVGQSQWLTPGTAIGFATGEGVASTGGGGGIPWVEPGGGGVSGLLPACAHPFEPHDEAGGADGGGDSSEYEYAFVLTDEWRERLVRPGGQGAGDQQRRQGRRSSSRRKRAPRPTAAETAPPPSAGTGSSRADHLQQELMDAKKRELATRWRLERAGSAPPAGRTVRRLETALTARFDEFCDACQPVVWPHASAR